MKNLLLFLLISTTSFAQNKKEQIEILNFRMDSLNTVLATTRDNSAKDIRELNDKINKVRDEVTTLQTSNNKLTKENEKFKTDLGELSKKNLELEAKLEAVELEKTSFKTVKIGNLEVMTEDLGAMKWNEAMAACADLGDGWRLPTIEELHVLFNNKDKIRGFDVKTYWSSTETCDDHVIPHNDEFPTMELNFDKSAIHSVRAVRGKTSFKYTVKVGNLEVMTRDLGKMKWGEAMAACADLGDGWRLPTKDELNVLYENQYEIEFGLFCDAVYWSSTEFGNFNAWAQNFGDGYQGSGKKGNYYYVRAVRAF